MFHVTYIVLIPIFLKLVSSVPEEPANISGSSAMTQRTIENENPRGLVERMVVPVTLHQRADGKPYASFGSVMPIHCATPEQVEELSKTTHHYCDVFTDSVLAPLGELAYVRIDDNLVEKVFINRTKRILISSSDGKLAVWRSAPSFESANRYVAGAPILNKDGALVSVVTARKGNYYAVSTLEGEGGYFESPLAWRPVYAGGGGGLIYGALSFESRESLRSHIASLPPPQLDLAAPAQPVLHTATQGARVSLVTQGGRQIAHVVLPNIITDPEYL